MRVSDSIESIEESESDVLAFKVEDSGIGIAEENVVKVFQPFQQVDMALDRSYEGTGLGLPIATDLARLLTRKSHRFGEKAFIVSC